MRPITAAESILLSLGIREPTEIDLEAIAASLGAFITYKPLDHCEAMIAGSAKKAVIVVNERSQPERQRFSIGHEIGHWHHHRGKVLMCAASDIANPRNGPLDPERQADNFASDLLLPTYMLTPRLAKLNRISLASARDLAGEFNASLTATLIAVMRSDNFPIVLVCHGTGGRRWGWSAPMIPTWWRLRQDLDPDTFAHALLFKGGSEERFPRKVGADAFFDFRGCDRYEVQEQSFRAFGQEIITILTIPEEGL